MIFVPNVIFYGTPSWASNHFIKWPKRVK